MQDEHAENRSGDRLRATIEGHGMSIAAFSRRAEIPYRSLQDYVAGKTKPGFDQLAKMAMIGLDVGYILTGHPTGNSAHPSGLGQIEGAYINKNKHVEEIVFGRYVVNKLVEPIIDKLPDILGLRDWVEIWNIAEDRAAKFLHWESKRRRQTAVFMTATHIADGILDRLRAQGWVVSEFTDLPLDE